MRDSGHVRTVRRALVELGATDIEIVYGGKHIEFRFVTAEGVAHKFTVSRAPSDNKKLESWARQAVRHAASRAAHAQNQKNRR